MFADLVLAVLHHIFAFGLVAALAVEAVLLRPGFDRAGVERILRIDLLYGLAALALVAAGIGRLYFGLKGPDHYLANHWFWAKMTVFVGIGIISILPTRTFARWRRQLRQDPAFAPEAGEVTRMRRLVLVENHLIVLVLIFAATMARYG